MRAKQVVSRLDLDLSARSGQVQNRPSGELCPELYIAFPNRGGMWVRFDGSYVSGWSDHGAYFACRFGLFGRLAIRRAVRDWLSRQPQNTTHKEPV